MNIKIALIDDQKQDRERVETFIKQYEKENNLYISCEHFSCGTDFLQSFTEGSYRLIFLDIIMNGHTGIDIARQIRKIDTKVAIVFTTLTPDFALEGYEVRAYAYLLKPFPYEKVTQILQETFYSLNLQQPFIEIRENRCSVKVLLDDILYVDVDNHYLQIHTANQVRRTYMRFRDFFPMVEKYGQFLCCYRNILVNMDRVLELDDLDFIMENEDRVPIKRTAKQELRQRYADYVFRKMSKRDDTDAIS